MTSSAPIRESFDRFEPIGTPPVVRGTDIRRSRLEHFRLQNGACRVVLVSAGAGYGKSTLLAQWRALAADPRPQAWLSLDPSDNAARGLLWRIIATLDSLAPLDAATFAAVGRRSPAIDRADLSSLTRCLRDRAPLVLTLDDAQHVTDPASLAILQHLVDVMPDGSQLVLASRTEPELCLDRLRASGELAELRADALAMTIDECRRYVDRIGVVSDARDISELHRLTEGWPAGIALAALTDRNAELEVELGHHARALDLAAPGHARHDRRRPGYDLLTPAERRVLAQLATHRTLAEIGKVLYVSRTTVKTHVASIYSKLGASTRHEAVACSPSYLSMDR